MALYGHSGIDKVFAFLFFCKSYIISPDEVYLYFSEQKYIFFTNKCNINEIIFITARLNKTKLSHYLVIQCNIGVLRMLIITKKEEENVFWVV